MENLQVLKEGIIESFNFGTLLALIGIIFLIGGVFLFYEILWKYGNKK